MESSDSCAELGLQHKSVEQFRAGSIIYTAYVMYLHMYAIVLFEVLFMKRVMKLPESRCRRRPSSPAARHVNLPHLVQTPVMQLAPSAVGRRLFNTRLKHWPSSDQPGTDQPTWSAYMYRLRTQKYLLDSCCRPLWRAAGCTDTAQTGC